MRDRLPEAAIDAVDATPFSTRRCVYICQLGGCRLCRVHRTTGRRRHAASPNQRLRARQVAPRGPVERGPRRPTTRRLRASSDRQPLRPGPASLQTKGACITTGSQHARSAADHDLCSTRHVARLPPYIKRGAHDGIRCGPVGAEPGTSTSRLWVPASERTHWVAQMIGALSRVMRRRVPFVVAKRPETALQPLTLPLRSLDRDVHRLDTVSLEEGIATVVRSVRDPATSVGATP
jgi:hypothetical protein